MNENISLEDFFIFYPSQDDKSLSEKLYRLKEFNELKLDVYEGVPRFRGDLMKHQKIIQRLVSPYTLVNKLLLVHATGTGKSCASIAVAENFLNNFIKNDGVVSIKPTQFKKSLVFMKNETLVRNFKNEIVKKCTVNKYTGFKRINKMISKSYDIHTFTELYRIMNQIKLNSHTIKQYSNRTIIIDEAHVLREHQEIKDKDGKIKLNIYDLMKSFLTKVQNCKVLLLSATPIVDNTEEFANLMNLILPLDSQLPIGDDFIKEYFTGNIISTQKALELKNIIGNYVSYIRPLSTDLKVVINGKIYKPLSHTKIYGIKASEYQTNIIKKASPGNFRSKQIEASIMVFPENKYGTEALKEYTTYDPLKPRVWRFKSKYVNDIKNNLQKYSCKINFIVKNILNNPDKLHYIYSKYVVYGGMILGAVLQLFNEEKGIKWSYITNKSQLNKGYHIALLTSNISDSLIDSIKNVIQQKDGKKKIQVIIGGPKISMGISFKQVDFVYDLNPPWNLSSQEQAFGRAIRADSHSKNSTIQIYRCATIFDQEGEISPDLDIYKIAENKDIKDQQIYRVIKQSAIDCQLAKNRNLLSTDEDGSRICNYQKCNYTCNGVEKKENKEILTTNYNLKYGNDLINSIINDVKNYLDDNLVIDMETISKKYKINNILLFRVISSIIKNRILMDKNGFYNLINYDKNKLFLSLDLVSKKQNSIVVNNSNLQDILNGINYNFDIEKLKSCSGDFKYIFSNISPFNKIMLIEFIYSVLNSKNLKTKYNQKQLGIFNDIILKYKEYIINVGGEVYNNLYKLYFEPHYKPFKKQLDQNIKRFDPEKNSWIYGNVKKVKKIKEEKTDVQFNKFYNDEKVPLFGYTDTKTGIFKLVLKYNKVKRDVTGINSNSVKIGELRDILLNKLNVKVNDITDEIINSKYCKQKVKIKDKDSAEQFINNNGKSCILLLLKSVLIKKGYYYTL